MLRSVNLSQWSAYLQLDQPPVYRAILLKVLKAMVDQMVPSDKDC